MEIRRIIPLSILLLDKKIPVGWNLKIGRLAVKKMVDCE